MAKWITAVAGVAVLALLFLLRYELSGGEAVASPTPRAAAAIVPVQAAAPIAPTEVTAPTPAQAAAPAPEGPHKLDTQSDAFFYKFDEVVPARLTREAASCYEGHAQIHRNKKLKLVFKTQIVSGEVTVHDVKVAESTLGDAALEACFVRKVQEAHWRDDELPDWVQDDQLVIRPERGMKKFMKANMEYEGDGPTGAAVITAGQEAPPSDSATKSSSDDW